MPIVHNTYKIAKINLINSGAMDIIRTGYYIHGPELTKLIFIIWSWTHEHMDSPRTEWLQWPDTSEGTITQKVVSKVC